MDASMEDEDIPHATLCHLPVELLEKILCCNSVDYIDLCNVSSTCRILLDVCQSNELWKRKLNQRWPVFIDRYSRSEAWDWIKLYRERHAQACKVQLMVKKMSPKFYMLEEVSNEDFEEFDGLMEEDALAGPMIVDELMRILHDSDSLKNLTEKFYAEKVLRHIQQRYLTKQWKEFLDLPEDQQSLERGAVLISQWCQPTVNLTENQLCDQLDNLACQVKDEIGRVLPQHPVLKEDLSCEYLAESKWSPENSRHILTAMNHILFEVLGFSGNSSDYYNEENSFIDKVLKHKKGIPITLSIVFSCVARRLGVVCEPVNFPSHFLLRWHEHPHATLEHQFTYIDAFNKGMFLTQAECASLLQVPQFIHSEIYQSVPSIQVFERMARNLINIGRQNSTRGANLVNLRNAVSLSLLLTPNDVEVRLMQIRVYLHLNIDIEEVIDSLQRVADLDQNRMELVAFLMHTAQKLLQEKKTSKKQKEIKVRGQRKGESVKYSVGMVMQHKLYDYMCVIYGWDSTCQATREWINQMGINNLDNKAAQPFYQVLVADGSNRYAAEENLKYPDSPSVIDHIEIGKYFQEFNGIYYVPNAEKQYEFPEDPEKTIDLTSKYRNRLPT